MRTPPPNSSFDAATAEPDAGGVGGPRVPRASWTALAILFAVAVFNFLDRTLIGILQIPLKADLGLTDTQLGALVGLAFGLVYTLFGLPLGRLADLTSRKWVLGVALAVWTTLTALSGTARNFGMLVVCRMGVALGEAACAPVSHSLISDLFPAQRRASALGVWSMGVPVGTILGFLLGGWLNSAIGWRGSFIWVGLAGAALVPLVLFALRDPPRGAFDDPRASTAPPPPLGDVFRAIWASRSYCGILLAASFHLLTIHSISAWLPQFFVRVHHLPVKEVGTIMALLAGLGGAVGMLAGGMVGDRLARRDQRWYLWLTAATLALFVPCALAQYWAASSAWAIAFGFAASALGGVWFAPMIALTQALMPARIRSFTGAFYVSFVNLFAMSCGPLLTGLLSDRLGARAEIGSEALRYALSVIQIGSAVAIFLFLLASRGLLGDLAASQGRVARGD